jgi:hypothetical protein
LSFLQISKLKQKDNILAKKDNNSIANRNNKDINNNYNNLIHLQQTSGNQVVQRMVNSNQIQAKLKISQPDDPYEREADRIAEKVMRMQSHEGSYHTTRTKDDKNINRKCKSCEDEEESEELKKIKISRMENDSSSNQSHVSDNFGKNINKVVSQRGSPLDASTREFMESKFGYDFGNVRIHADERAARSARSINALAYTIGNKIIFGEAQYRPYTFEGKRLLAHELTHIIQQAGVKNNDNYNEHSQSLYSYGITNHAKTDVGISRYSTQDCEKNDITSIHPSDVIAKIMAVRSVGKLKSYLSTPTSDPHVRDLLLKNFNDDSLSTVRQVYANFKKIETELLGEDYQYECENDCDEENAYVYGFWTDIHLCMNQLKGLPTEYIAHVIVHEMSHYAADTSDHEYFYPGTGVTSLSPSKAIDNADSYQGFAGRI